MEYGIWNMEYGIWNIRNASGVRGKSNSSNSDQERKKSIPVLDTDGGGVLPIMAYKGRLLPKGVTFSGFRYMKG